MFGHLGLELDLFFLLADKCQLLQVLYLTRPTDDLCL